LAMIEVGRYQMTINVETPKTFDIQTASAFEQNRPTSIFHGVVDLRDGIAYQPFKCEKVIVHLRPNVKLRGAALLRRPARTTGYALAIEANSC
jgi:hypothetical protein